MTFFNPLKRNFIGKAKCKIKTYDLYTLVDIITLWTFSLWLFCLLECVCMYVFCVSW